VDGSQGTSLTGVPTGLTGLARKYGGAANFMPTSKVMKKKPSFAEFLHKYQKIAVQKQNNRLRDEQSRNSSSPTAKKHQRSSYWTSSFISSMHVPWNAYSGINNYNPWFWYNSWSSFFNYQYYACDAPRSYSWPP
jgi:hypothetical protein